MSPNGLGSVASEGGPDLAKALEVNATAIRLLPTRLSQLLAKYQGGRPSVLLERKHQINQPPMPYRVTETIPPKRSVPTVVRPTAT